MSGNNMDAMRNHIYWEIKSKNEARYKNNGSQRGNFSDIM